MAQPPAKPWKNRAAIITAMLGLSAQTMEATPITTTAASSGRRRPTWSDTGPPTSWPSDIPTKKVVRVSCTWVAVATRSPATCGKAGTYMSVASGAIAVTNTTVATRAEVMPARRRSGVTTVSGALGAGEGALGWGAVGCGSCTEIGFLRGGAGP